VQNPASNPLGPWTYSGPGGANSSRTFFSPLAAGAGMGSIGWISIVSGSTITTTNPTISLAPLAGNPDFDLGGGVLKDTIIYTITFVHTPETAVVARSAIFEYGLTSTGTVVFVDGGNGDLSQTFSSLTGVGAQGFNTGGTLGITPERTWTVRFQGVGLTTADTLTFSFTHVGSIPVNTAFTFLDCVDLTATSDPSPLEPVLQYPFPVGFPPNGFEVDEACSSGICTMCVHHQTVSFGEEATSLSGKVFVRNDANQIIFCIGLPSLGNLVPPQPHLTFKICGLLTPI